MTDEAMGNLRPAMRRDARKLVSFSR